MLAKRKESASLADIVAVSVGNAIEWFEIVVYGYFAGIIAGLFFPTNVPSVSLLLAFATFGIPFVARPLGAVVLGAYADRRGRKAALQLSIVMMMAASAAIAFVPDYRSIGILAPGILVLARIAQGFAVGGEFGSATAFLAEQDVKRRGFFASWQFASQGVSGALATAFGAATTGLLSVEQMNSWGWRLPFVFGLSIAPLSYYIRKRLHETAEFTAISVERSPLLSLLNEKKRHLVAAVGLIVLGTVATYTIVFMPTFAARQLGIAVPGAYAVALLTASLQIVIVPIVGALSDRWGRAPICVAAAAAILIAVYPMFVWLAEQPTVERLLVIQIALGALTACYVAPLPALMSELFPVGMRTTGLSISYSLGVAIFGGFTPLMQAWLIQHTESALAPSYYVMFAAGISLMSLFMIRRFENASAT